MNKLMIVWGFTVALALIAAILVYQFTSPAPGEAPVGSTLYAGEQPFTPAEFDEFKIFVGSSPDIHLEHSEVTSNSTETLRMAFQIIVPDNVECPYGLPASSWFKPPENWEGIAYGIVAFIVVILGGAGISNIPKLRQGQGGKSWGRH